MITIERLTKKYGAFTAVDDVSFTAQAGRVTGFLGPNGAGKSTTMRMMVALTVPTSGGVTILGRRFADLPNPGLEVGVLLPCWTVTQGLLHRDQKQLRGQQPPTPPHGRAHRRFHRAPTPIRPQPPHRRLVQVQIQIP